MFKFIDKRIVLIVVALSILIFLGITATQQGGTQLRKKELNDSKTVVQNLKKESKTLSEEELVINKGYFQQKCKRPIEKTLSNLEGFEEDKLKKETLMSHRLLFECYNLAGNYDDAAKHLGKIIKAEPQVPKWHGMMAETLLKSNKLSIAKRYAHLASQLAPSNSKWYELEADILSKYNKNYEAISLYKKAMQYADLEDADRLAKKIDVLSYQDSKQSSNAILLTTNLAAV